MKALSHYNQDKSRRDGLQSRCRECRNSDKRRSHAENPDARRERDRLHRERSSDKIAAYQREYRELNSADINEKRRQARKENPEPHRERSRKYYAEHRDEGVERSAQWRMENPDRFLDGVRKWHEENPDSRRDINRRHKIKLLSTPKGRIEANIRRGIRRGLLPGSKAGRSTFNLLGYTADDLRGHIESLFVTGMTWENYGDWHIDHIVPLAVHNYDSPDDFDFKRAWSLSNLQPLFARENLSKGKKLGKPFQASLKGA